MKTGSEAVAGMNAMDRLVVGDNLQDQIARAQTGDTEAARLALWGMGHCLIDRGESVPDFVREHLGKALYAMFNGTPPDVALGLKQKGRPRRSHRATRAAAYLVWQGVREHGNKLEDAAYSAAEQINSARKSKRLAGIWHSLGDEVMTQEMLVKWYVRHRKELDSLYGLAK